MEVVSGWLNTKKSHRLTVLADYLSFQLFQDMKKCVFVSLLCEHFISGTESCVYNCSVLQGI